MHAVMAILAALVPRDRTGEGAVPRRVGGRRRARADGAARRRVPRHRRGPGAAPRAPHRPLRLLRHLRAPRTAGGWRSPPSSRRFWANLCRLLSASSSGSSTRPTTRVQDEIRADDAAPCSPTEGPRRVGGRAVAGADTCVAPVLTVPEVVDDPQFAARGAFVDAVHPDTGRSARSARRSRAWSAPTPARCARRDRDRHRRAARRRRAVGPTRCAEAPRRGWWWHERPICRTT